ncbi:hypothetical protein SAMN05421678_106246 [Actinopolymorpha cephalotaxi]|uniref:Carbohydrate ABC transporter permease n=1 Tax=Actinopolymorpha cephalotaxi TaxID=504797 RepID=A0A1I2SSB6_9ACTN|nr:hypothetical protein SAMN05421678_106246 [Actinopolymorpha cephalotaxi]
MSGRAGPSRRRFLSLAAGSLAATAVGACGPDKFTLPLELAQASQTLGVASYETVIAGALLASVPGLIVFLTFQRHLLRGVVVGGLKS